MKQLKWSTDQIKNHNGKIGPLTMFTVSYNNKEQCHILVPKLPGLHRAIKVGSIEEGEKLAEMLYKKYVEYLLGPEGFETILNDVKG